MRAIWSGSLSFGLIHLPVKLYSASKERALRFKLLEKQSLCPVSYVRFCRDTGREVAYRNVVRGYEDKKGHYVVLTKEDMKRVRSGGAHDIRVLSFSDSNTLDPLLYDKPYYIEPDPKAKKAYVLLRAALAQTGMVAIASVVLKDKEHVAAIWARENALILSQLRYATEIRAVTDLRIPVRADYSERELQLMLAFVHDLRTPFEARRYHDAYTEELEHIIKARAKGVTLSTSPLPSPLPMTEMRELMSALNNSVERAPKRRRRTRARKQVARQTA